METGDLCADTAPMPKSKVCQDPGAVSDTCGVTTYQGTPYNNYMSYTGKMNAHLLQLHLLQKSKCTVSPAIKKKTHLTSKLQDTYTSMYPLLEW